MIGDLFRHAGEEFRSRGTISTPVIGPPPALPPTPLNPSCDFRVRSIDGHAFRECCDPGECRNDARWSVTITTTAAVSPTYVRCDIHAILLVQDAMARRR